MRWINEQYFILLLAIQFLSRLPVPLPEGAFSEARLQKSPRYYPLVGLVIGLMVALFYWLSYQLWSGLIATVLSTVLGILITGAFHEDGLADTFDGIGGGLTRERALEIMKDSRIGTYGAIALVGILALKVTAISQMPASAAVFAIIVAHVISRTSAVFVISTSRYVRFEGKAKPVASERDGVGLSICIALSGLIAMSVVFLSGIMIVPFAGGIAGTLIGHTLVRLVFEPKLGGYTGDTLGATQQVSEVGFYLGLLACL